MLLYFIFLTYWITPWKIALLEKPTGSQLVKKLPALYGTRNFVTAFTIAGHLSLSRARPIQFMPPSHFLKINPNIILPSRPGSSMWPLSLILPHQKPVCTSPCPNTCYMPRPSQSSRFDYPNIIWWGAHIIKFFIM
jgi:hypothetical protein